MIIDSGVITGSLVVSGSYNQTGSAVIHGDLTVLGTINAVISGSTTSASYARNADTASYAPNYLPLTGGTVNGNLVVNGTGSFNVIVTTYESSSVIYSSGSTKFGDSLDDTHQFTGSVSVTGSLVASTGITGSLLGTASLANSIVGGGTNRILFQSAANTTATDSNFTWDGDVLTLDGPTGSIVLPYTGKIQSALYSGNNITVGDGSGSMRLTTDGVDRIKIRYGYTSSIDFVGPLVAPQGVTASLFGTSSYAVTASYALSSSYASTASYVALAQTASYALSASNALSAQTASYVLNAVSSSYASTASYVALAQTASYIETAQTASYVFSAISASRAVTAASAVTASYVANAQTASYVENAQTASYVLNAVSASYALTASYAPGSGTSVSASYALTASYAVSASNADLLDGKQATTFATTGSNTFFGSETITGNIILSGSSQIQGRGDSTNMLFGMFDGSSIFGPYYQIFGNNYTDATQRGSAEFVYDNRNGGGSGFNIASFDGSTWTRKFRVDDNGVQITGSLKVTSGASGSFSGSFQGNGSGLTNVPASGIVGLQLNQIGSGSVTASIAPDLGFRVNTDSQITGSLIVSNGISGNLNGQVTGSFSGSLYNLQNSLINHIPYFSQSQILADSAIIQVDNGLDQGFSIAINQNGVDATNPEALFVYQASTSSFNVISGKGNLNNYLQLNIQNTNNGANASSDVVATANNGNETTNFIDMGINGANFSGGIGGANDAYIYSTGVHLHIGNATAGQYVGFFAGGDDVDANMKLLLNAGNLHELTGSLNASEGFTGSLQGNADTATSASYAATASFGANFTASNALINNTLTAQTLIVQTITSSVEYSSGSNIFGSLLTNTQQLTGSVTVTGSLAVNGSSVILTNQTSSMSVLSSSYALTASYAPGSDTAISASYALSASYAQTAPAYVTTASYNQDSASFSTRDTNLEATASSLVAASGSFSTRVTVLESASASFATQSGSNSVRLTNLESTASVLTSASASFATVSASFSSTSGSLSTRVTNTEATASQFIVASGSLSTRTTNLESTASVLTSASASFSTRDTNLEATASTLVSFSASYVVASGSNSTRVTNLESTASQFVVASASLSTRTTNLESTASSNVASIISLTSKTGSYATTGSNTFIGKETISGSIRFAETIDPDPTGADAVSTYLFESASNTALGRDLYFRQDGNLTKWKWIESQLQTGLLYGGALSFSGSTLYANSGSGLIMTYNASYGSETSPIAQYVTWGPITASATYVTSSTQTYVYIDSTGNLQQQTSWFTPDQYTNAIPLGVFYHGNKATITSTSGDVATVYNTTNQSFDFIRAFGPLKLNGLTVGGNTGSMQLNISNGTSFVLGGFYQQDQNNVSHYNTNAQPTASIARWYRSGSTGEFIVDTNGGAFYTTVDNTKYDNGTGTLATVGNSNWTIQRAFENPVTGKVAVYYGQKLYASLADAQAGLASDPFTEGTLTAHNNVFIAYLILQGNASNTDITNAVNSITQAGLFRNTAGSSGGTSFGQTLESLTDVTITSPANGEALIYQGGNWVNGIATQAYTASYVLNAVSASYSSTASYVANAQTASYVNPLNQNVQITGSLSISSSASVLNIVGNGFGQASLISPNGALVLTPGLYGVQINGANPDLTVNGNITSTGTNSSLTGSLFGTASLAQTASYVANAQTASYVLNAVSASYATTASYVANAQTASYVLNAVSSSYALTAPYYVLTSSYNADSSSFSTRVTNTESTASTLVAASASFAMMSGSLSTRVTNLESTSSTLTSASASFSTRVTNTEATASSLVAASASFVANYVKNSQTSSMTVLSSSYALTASYVANAQTASYVLNAVSASRAVSAANADTASYVANAQTASYVLNAVSASYSLTASAANIFTANQITASNITVTGTVTAQTLNVQQVTSSIVYSSGSNKFGSLLTDVQQFTGSVTITGSLQVNGRTPLYVDQTSSLSVTSASYAATASTANSTATVPFIVGGTATYYGTINSSTIGSNNVFTLSTGSYRAAKFLYTVSNGTNARTGEILAVWNAGNTSFTDMSTVDLGSTTAVTASVSIVSSQAQLNFQTNTSGWTIKSQGTLI